MAENVLPTGAAADNTEMVLEDTQLLPLLPSAHFGEEADSSSTGSDSYWSRSESRIWTVMLLLGTCQLYCTRVTLPICASTMAVKFGWDKKQTGIVLGSFFWGYCFTQVVGGYVSDRIGGERVILLSTAAWGCITTLTPVVTHICTTPIVCLTLLRFLMGLMQGVYFPSLVSIFSQKVRESERAFTASTVGTGSHIGTLMIGWVGSLLLEWYDWQSVFFFSGLLTLIWAFQTWNRFFRGKGPLLSLESAGAYVSPSKHAQVPWKQLFKKAPVWAVILSHLCVSGSFFTLSSWLPTFFKDTFPESKGWVFNVVPWLFAIPSSIFGGWLSDHLIGLGFETAFVRKIMQCIAMGASGVFIFSLSSAANYRWAVVFVSAAMGLQTFHNSGASVNVQDLTPSCAGSLFGVMNTAGALLGVFLVYLSGCLIDVTGSWASVFNLVVLANAFGLLMFLVFGDAKRVDIDTSEEVTQWDLNKQSNLKPGLPSL
ncbi:solute carrier family 17 member 9 [Protopterus annectens]|uniref:solute carrier family 17 member 9 n=1 Tax=Protopterus annectens TaxID=7888 RepID=UPI001CF968E4|nr:solute carrier family 17 member 9 [Protopterus annectens]